VFWVLLLFGYTTNNAKKLKVLKAKTSKVIKLKEKTKSQNLLSINRAGKRSQKLELAFN
jgi:hypothetical protein